MRRTVVAVALVGFGVWFAICGTGVTSVLPIGDCGFEHPVIAYVALSAIGATLAYVPLLAFARTRWEALAYAAASATILAAIVRLGMDDGTWWAAILLTYPGTAAAIARARGMHDLTRRGRTLAIVAVVAITFGLALGGMVLRAPFTDCAEI